MKQQAITQTPRQIMPPQTRGLLPHTAVRTIGQDRFGNSSAGSRFGHDFSQVAADPLVPIVSQSYLSAPSLPRVQAKLEIGSPDDKYEREADRVAEQVMRMPDPRLSSSVGDSLMANGGNPSNGTIQRVCAPCSAEYKTAEDEKRSVKSANLCPKCRTQEEVLSQIKKITPFIQRQESLGKKKKELVQAKIAGESIPEMTPEISPGIQSLQGGGRPMSGSERGFFEPRFGVDFSGIRVHDDARAAGVARSINARAFTLGRNVVFGAGEYSSDTLAGRNLLAHELTHVVQQSGANELRGDQNNGKIAQAPSCTYTSSSGCMLQRAVSADWDTIENNLSYGLLDWAIRDYEAREVLAILSGLSDVDLADTIGAMDRDGLLKRLLDNISTEDEERYAVLIGRITRYRSVSHTTARIMDRLTRGVFDWAITDSDAREALHFLMGLDFQQLRTVIAHLVNNSGFDTLMDELPAEEHQRFTAFISRLREIRNEFIVLVSSHTEFLRSQPEGAGRTVRNITDRTGYGSSRATWSDLSPEQQKEWRNRASTAIAAIIVSVRGTDLEDIVSRSHFDFAPERAERLNAFAYVSGTNTLQFGRSWVQNAESNPINVWQSIAHELGGHEEFGNTWSWEIMQGTLRRMTPEERRIALGSANNLYSAYGYLETEIYAELRELPYRIETSRGDRPDSTSGRPGDVHDKLIKIQNAFGPEVGRQIVLRLYYRVMGDPRVSDASKRLLFTEIQTVFGLFPIAEPINP